MHLERPKLVSLLYSKAEFSNGGRDLNGPRRRGAGFGRKGLRFVGMVFRNRLIVKELGILIIDFASHLLLESLRNTRGTGGKMAPARASGC
jgi:hypothetical protein